jgi:glycosyltransferase involved in cell wall biosynthesis
MGGRGFSILPGAPEPRYRASYSPSDKMRIGYFGSLSDTRSLSHLIEAIAEFFFQFPECKEKIELNIYGGGLDEASSTILLANDLQNIVLPHGRLEYDSVTGLTGRDQISKLMQQSDYLLLLHGEHTTCSEYIPSKLYEYWWAQRPILALVHENIQLRKLIADLSDQNIICDSTASRGEYILMMKRAWTQWKAGGIERFETSMSPLTPEKGARHIVERVATQLGFGSK